MLCDTMLYCICNIHAYVHIYIYKQCIYIIYDVYIKVYQGISFELDIVSVTWLCFLKLLNGSEAISPAPRWPCWCPLCWSNLSCAGPIAGIRGTLAMCCRHMTKVCIHIPRHAYLHIHSHIIYHYIYILYTVCIYINAHTHIYIYL